MRRDGLYQMVKHLVSEGTLIPHPAPIRRR
jgi:hypothetical protein